MTTAAQGISKTVAYKKQTGLGSPASGSGGQLIRRRTFVPQSPPDTYTSDEIVSHQQSTGVSIGAMKPVAKLSALLSAGSYTALLGSLLRRDFAAIAASTGLSITIAASGSNFTLTRAAGSWLTDGVKIGHVGRLSVGTFNAANSNKNLLVLGVTATVLTVAVLNGVTMVAEGPITGSTFTVVGKETHVPTAGHTNDFYTIEDYYADVARSELYTDVQPAQAQFTISPTGNAQLDLDFVGLSRTLGGSQVLTSPSAETTSPVMNGTNGLVICNGVVVATITAFQVTINGNVTQSDLTLGSKVATNTQRGRIEVSGQFSAQFTDATLQAIKDAGSTTSLILVIANDQTAASDFVSLNIPLINLTNDSPDDAEKVIVRTYPFTAKINSAGGAGLSTEQTIVSIQDSAAP